jgi:hypothetical protein
LWRIKVYLSGSDVHTSQLERDTGAIASQTALNAENSLFCANSGKFNNDSDVGSGSVSAMSRKVQVKQQSIAKPTCKRLLATVPFENGFHFYTGIGNYTGITATNLNEFAVKLQTVPIESVTFHFERKDFQQWIKDTIKDSELAEQMNRIKHGLPAEDLRKEILHTVNARLNEIN